QPIGLTAYWSGNQAAVRANAWGRWRSPVDGRHRWRDGNFAGILWPAKPGFAGYAGFGGFRRALYTRAKMSFLKKKRVFFKSGGAETNPPNPQTPQTSHVVITRTP